MIDDDVFFGDGDGDGDDDGDDDDDDDGDDEPPAFETNIISSQQPQRPQNSSDVQSSK